MEHSGSDEEDLSQASSPALHPEGQIGYVRDLPPALSPLSSPVPRSEPMDIPPTEHARRYKVISTDYRATKLGQKIKIKLLNVGPSLWPILETTGEASAQKIHEEMSERANKIARKQNSERKKKQTANVARYSDADIDELLASSSSSSTSTSDMDIDPLDISSMETIFPLEHMQVEEEPEYKFVQIQPPTITAAPLLLARLTEFKSQEQAPEKKECLNVPVNDLDTDGFQTTSSKMNENTAPSQFLKLIKTSLLQPPVKNEETGPGEYVEEESESEDNSTAGTVEQSADTAQTSDIVTKTDIVHSQRDIQAATPFEYATQKHFNRTFTTQYSAYQPITPVVTPPEAVIINQPPTIPRNIVISASRSLPPLSYSGRLGLLQRVITKDNYTIEELENANLNSWAETANTLLVKIRDKKDATARDVMHYHSIKGFLYHQVLETAEREEQGRSSFYPTKTLEYNPEPSRQTGPVYPCRFCETVHSDPEPCVDPYDNGPRSLQALKISDQWRRTTQAVVISYDKYRYLPPDLRDRFISLMIPNDLSYPTNPYCEVTQYQTSSLYLKLAEILQVLGKHTSFVIYVEFLRSHCDTTSPLTKHYCGFVKVLKALQANFGGIIVALKGVVYPMPCERIEEYFTRKINTRAAAQILIATGLALGVPTGIIGIQNLTPFESGTTFKLPAWRVEPLFNSYGKRTREFHHRLASWFVTRTDKLLRKLPVMISYVGPPQSSILDG
jgi:hypothetical protein